jgi:hypothetical protein
MVIAAIDKLPAMFRYADLARPCPNVSRPTIKRVLGLLRHEGKVECVKPGRNAVWEKRGQDAIDGIVNGHFAVGAVISMVLRHIAMCQQAGTGMRMMRGERQKLGIPAATYKNSRPCNAFQFFIAEQDSEQAGSD